MERVLRRLRDYGFKINPKKCELVRSRVEYLGHRISSEGYYPSVNNLKAIREYPKPTSVAMARTYIGMCSFFRKFIKDFAKIAEPLTRMLGKDKKFEWNSEQDVAFEKLREFLLADPILKAPEWDKPFHIFTDASNVAVGCTLMQKDGSGKYHVISYLSRALTSSERNWPTVQAELYAIVYALRKFNYYLYGHEVIIHTDHKPLEHLLAKGRPHSNLARWLLEIQGHPDLKIEHIDGKKNTVADALSESKTGWEDPKTTAS